MRSAALRDARVFGAIPSFQGDAKHRTRNLEIPGLVLTHHPGMTEVNFNTDGEPPLPLWERVGVRGPGLSIVRYPSPGLHLAMQSDLSHKGRGEVSARHSPRHC